MKDDLLALFVAVALTALWTADTVLDLHWFDSLSAIEMRPEVTFAIVKPVFKDRCLQCHSTPGWNWTDYDTAYQRRNLIKHRVWILRNMPSNGQITEEERQLIKDWVDAGGKP